MFYNFIFLFLKKVKSNGRSLVPILATLGLLFFIRLTYSVYGIGSGSIRSIRGVAVFESASHPKYNASPQLTDVYTWAACSLIAIVVFVSTIIACSTTIKETLYQKKMSQRNMILFVILSLTAVVSLLFVVLGKSQFFITPLKIMFQEYKVLPRIELTYLMDFLAIWEALMFIAAFCFLNSPLSDEKPISIEIVKRTRLASMLLYLGAFTLAIGILEFNFLFRLVANPSSIGLTNFQMSTISKGLMLLVGTICSLFIMVLFIPTALILNGEAMKITSAKGNIADNSWTEETQISGIMQNKIGKLLAILAPVLTGILGEPIANGLSLLFKGQ